MASDTHFLPPSTEPEGEYTREKKPRVRSNAYPSYTIEYCYEFTKKIHVNFGNSAFNQREEIAKVLKVSVSHIQTQLSSAVQYGLVEMKMKVGYKPSEQFVRLYKPINDEERNEALLDCLLSPDLYKKLLAQYKGGLVPSLVALSTILFRNHNIAEGASENASEIFYKNLQDLNLLDNENYLHFERDIEDESNEPSSTTTKEHDRSNKVVLQQPQKIINVPSNSRADTIIEFEENYPILIPLKENRLAKLIIPKGYTDEDLNKVCRFIEALRE